MRKKVKVEPALQSWADVDNALKMVGEYERCLDEIKIEMERQQAAAKEKADAQAQQYHEKIKKLERDMKDFTTLHRDELDGKSKQLNFGNVGFRLNTKVMTPNEPDIIANLKRYGMADCINVKEKVFKEVLRKYPTDDIHKVGAYLKVTDDFGYDVDREKLQPTE